jgi:putative transcription factor
MTSCEMCGHPNGSNKVNVEGVIMQTCQICSKYGTVILREQAPLTNFQPIKKFKPKSYKAPEMKITDNFHTKIRNSRNNRNLTQEQFATMLTEKQSIIQKLELGTFTPSINLAKKIEKTLNIKLLEQDNYESEFQPTQNNAATTIGDMIKRK